MNNCPPETPGLCLKQAGEPPVGFAVFRAFLKTSLNGIFVEIRTLLLTLGIKCMLMQKNTNISIDITP